MFKPLPLVSLLHEYRVTPSKSLGQNFLIDEGYLRRIVESASVSSQDEVLEIGAGAGSLTRHLAQSAAHVTAIELDQALFPLLRVVLKDFKNVRLIQGDIMKKSPEELVSASGYKVVANIPYYLTSNLIRRLLEAPWKPSMLALTIQREVAERVCEAEGEMSLLSLSVQLYGKPGIALHIPAGAFYPVSNVDSALLLVDVYADARIPADYRDVFFKLAKAAFSQKRKMLRNALVAAPGINKDTVNKILEDAGIDPCRRAQTLTLQEWSTLSEIYEKHRLPILYN